MAGNESWIDERVKAVFTTSESLLPYHQAGANGQSGEFFTDDNLVAAGSLLVVLPTVLIHPILRRRFISGLAVGATKG